MSVDQWEWKGDAPTVDQAVERLGTLPPVFGLRTVDYAEFVIPMQNKEKVEKDGRDVWEDTWKLYFQVAGRQTMLRDTVDRFEWEVTETEEVLEHGNAMLVRMKITIKGQIPRGESGHPLDWTKFAKADEAIPTGTRHLQRIRGHRYGLGSVKSGKSGWEKGETTARGRALGAWGFGLLPGSGLASLDEMQYHNEAEPYDQTQTRRANEEEVPGTVDELIPIVLTLIEQLRQVKGATDEEARTKTAEFVQHKLGQAILKGDSLDLTVLNRGQLILLKNKYEGWIREARAAANA